MKSHSGILASPIWLLGDSNPANWEHSIQFPLDPHHPTRHSIWTPILHQLERNLYSDYNLFLDDQKFFVCNAIISAEDKPKPAVKLWEGNVEDRILRFRHNISSYSPILILCFGGFAFEFARRSLGQGPIVSFGKWTIRKLGSEFKDRSSRLKANITNIIPLLHATIARQFSKAHSEFTGDPVGNYFEFVADHLAPFCADQLQGKDIWLPMRSGHKLNGCSG